MGLTKRQRERGSILVLTMIILFVVAGFTGALLSVSVSSQTTASVNQKRLTARSLAESAVETAKQWLQTQWSNQNGAGIVAKSVTTVSQLSNPAVWTTVTVDGLDARYAIVAVPPSLFPMPTGASKVGMTPDGKGWWVDGTDGVRTIHYLYSVMGRAEYTPKQSAGDSRTVAASVSRVIEASLTPLFQYAVFYNADLEILPGPDMTLTGRVHSNRDMYLGCGGTLKMDTDYVRAVGKIFRKRKDDNTPSIGQVVVKNLAKLADATPLNDFQTTLPNGTTHTSKIFSKAELAALGVSTPFGFDSNFGGYDSNSNGSLNDGGDWKAWASQAMSFYGGTVQTSDMDVPKSEPPQQNTTTDPFQPTTGGDYAPDGMGGFIPVPPGTGSYSKGFFHGKSGLSIINGVPYSPDGTNLTSALLAGTLSISSVYDAREGKNVPQTKIDVLKLKQSLEQPGTTGPLGKLKSSWNGLIYASKTGITSAAPAGVMLANGSELPNQPSTGAQIGMTVATNLPIYVHGDFNTKVNGVASAVNDPAYHKPAAVIADAVNLLSNAWNNTKTSSSGLPVASATTFNTAMIAGNTDSVPGSSYNGGLENLPRFHENWTGKNCTIAGSFVNLWKSKIAKGPWVYGGNKYTAPNRIWDFDPNYKDYTKIPPFTPIAVSMSDVAAE